MALFKHVEFEVEKADGTRFPLESSRRHLTAISGLGMPPLQIWSTRSPFQDGETHWGQAYKPRIVNMGLLLRACDRSGLWDWRKDAVDLFSPKSGPHKLRLRRDDRQVFELHDLWVTQGPDAPFTDLDDPWSQEVAVQLKAMDPFWKWTTAPLAAGQTRDSEGRVCVLETTFTVREELTLPFTGPFLLGTTVGTATMTAYNAGTWAARPVVSVTGPLSDWMLTNDTNGDQITWNGYVIADEETVTVDVPANESYNQDGDDLTAYAGGQTGSFELEPGANSLSFWCADIDNSGLYWLEPVLQVCWYVEVLGT